MGSRSHKDLSGRPRFRRLAAVRTFIAADECGRDVAQHAVHRLSAEPGQAWNILAVGGACVHAVVVRGHCVQALDRKAGQVEGVEAGVLGERARLGGGDGVGESQIDINTAGLRGLVDGGRSSAMSGRSCCSDFGFCPLRSWLPTFLSTWAAYGPITPLSSLFSAEAAGLCWLFDEVCSGSRTEPMRPTRMRIARVMPAMPRGCLYQGFPVCGGPLSHGGAGSAGCSARHGARHSAGSEPSVM